MKSIKYNIQFVFITMGLLVWSCDDLDTSNLNNPDTQQVLAIGDDLIGVLGGGYVSWWQGIHQSHPGMTLSVAADAVSCSWGNFGMQRMSEEPRDPYNNQSSETQDYQQVVTDPWQGGYAGVFNANAVLAAILNDGLTLGSEDQDQMILASAYFLRGISLGYLGLMFDQAYITDENTDLLEPLEFSPYQEVIEAAVQDMERAIDVANGGIDFIMDASFFNGLTMSNAQLGRLANSYAARFLVQGARTEEETNAVDWNRVLAFTENGITEDFAPIADGNFWFGYWRYAHIGTGGPEGSWARLDMRLVNALDPSMPTRFPLDGNGLADPVATSADARLESDFTFVATNNFRPERGLWHYSHYKHSRNLSEPEYMGDGNAVGPMPAFVVADNEMLKAEANYRLGNEAEAAAIVNAGTRVTRGGLNPVASSGEEILNAIIYERYIETLNTGPGGHYFDRRRIGERIESTNLDALGGLQTGTPAHLPVPAIELEVFELETYNFGGDSDPTGLVRQ